MSDLPPHPLTRLLERLHEDLRPETSGRNKQSIPRLAEAPDAFGVAVVTTTGQVHTAGDATVPFSLQSAVKPFVYALALADSGRDTVMSAIGVEPTGEAFDAIRLEEETGRPPNPMVNAGAILTCCLVAGDTAEERAERITRGVSAFAGRDLDVDEEVYAQERDHAHRNMALAHLMASDGTLPQPVHDAVDVYLRACSLEVTAVDLAVMGATLAAGGVNPCTGEQVIPVEVVSTVLTVMATCGMYDGAGGWFVRVGLPAKSGVGGGVVATKPGQLGVGTFSPPLDEHGNSVRGVLACERLTDMLGLHEFAPDGTGVSVVRRTLDGADARSAAERSSEQEEVLRRHADRLRVMELQGPLSIISASTLCRVLRESEVGRATPCWLVLDLHDVGHIDPPALDLAKETFADLGQRGVRVVLVDRERPTAAPWSASTPDDTVGEVDDALRRCEDELLAALGG